MSVDQTFHTPSFGDEEFEIPPITFAPSVSSSARCGNSAGVFTNQMSVGYLKHRLNGGQIYVYLPPHNCNTEDRLYSNHTLSSHQQPNVIFNQLSCQQTLSRSNGLHTSSPSGPVMDNNSYHSPTQSAGGAMSPHQDMYQNSGEMIAPHSMHMRLQSYDNRGTCSNVQMQHQSAMQPNQMNMMPQQQQGPHMVTVASPQQQTVFSTISQSQLSSQLGMQIGMGTNPHYSPPGSTHNSPAVETSEDSDDSTPLAQLLGGMKRPSPEPIDISQSKLPKKPKAQKKKKKRDPNEPQKPVSAYALFFRDTQAAIKGQNPNASFGEVSKIVASMWDSLDADTKNCYKKKTESAKKEYLKALAAYRASLVSKAAVDHSDSPYMSNAITCASPPTSSPPSNSPPGQMLSPVQKKSPVLTSIIDTMQPVTTMEVPQTTYTQQQTMAVGKTWCAQQQQHMMNNSPPHMMHNSQMMSPSHAQQMTQQRSPPHMTVVGSPQMNQISAVPPQVNHSNSNSPTYPQNVSPASMGGPPQNVGGGEMVPPLQNCLRNGCPNPAIDSPDWDREYCSSECVVSHCRDVFTAWVASRQANNTYASVK